MIATADAVTGMPAHRVAAAIAAGRLGARDVVEAHLARIDAFDGRIGAVIARCDARARDEADRIDAQIARGEPVGPLAGVPMTIKDLHATADVTTTFGIPWLHAHRPLHDAAAVARLRAAGAIVIGKSNVPLAGYDWQCRHPTRGVTRNPHDLRRTCGGSSGGAAAALAAGFSALELGSDLAGSIRVPAHFCGVFGLVTSEGAVPLEGHGPPGSRVESMCSIGPLARSLDDLELAFDVLTGTKRTAPPRSVSRPLRIAWSTSVCGIAADAATRDALAATVASLAAAGATVVEARPPHCDDATPLRIWGGVDGDEFRASWPPPFRWPGFRAVFGCGIVGAMIGPSALSRALARGMTGGMRHADAARAQRREFAAAMNGWLADFDAWLTPCSATAAFTHRRLPRAIDVDGLQVRYSLAQSAFCCPVNVAGACSVATPAGTTPEGLPIGLQWIAAHGRDRELLATVAATRGRPAQRSPGAVP